MLRRYAPTAILLLTALPTLTAQAPVARYPGFARPAPAGDIDRDGTPDFVVQDGAAATAFSGRDGTLLVRIPGAFTLPGTPLDEDLDGDGRAELLLGGPVDAEIRSGRTGALLRRSSGPLQLAGGLHGIGDIDGDGVTDYSAVFAESANGTLQAALFSGVDGSDIRRQSIALPTAVIDVVGLGDIDGDGRCDYVIYSPGALFVLPAVGEFYSGRTHTRIARTRPTPDGDLVPLRADVNADGTDDYALVYLGFRGNPVGTAQLVSGRDETVLDQWQARFGPMVAVADADADGITDLAYVHADITSQVVVRATGRGATVWDYDLGNVTVGSLTGLGDRDGNGNGRPQLIAGVFGPARAIVIDPAGAPDFVGSQAAASVTGEPQQTLNLTAPASEAGKSYWILGSLSGTAPGVPLAAGRVLPLNFDAYTAVTASGAAALLQGATGVLDGQGAASARLTVPAVAAAAGLTLHHAYAVLGASSIDYVSSAVPLALLP